MQTYTYKEVLQRIEDLTDLIDVSALEKKLKRLIYKAAIDSMSAQSLLTKTDVIDVVEGLAKKPCDLLRLLRVKPYNVKSSTIQDNTIGDRYYRNRTPMEPTRLGKSTSYDHDSRYIKPSWVRNGQVIISYLAVPVIETEKDGKTIEEVAISYDQLDYCAYEAARIVLRDEAARGNIAYPIYQSFEQESDWKFNVATGNSFQFSIDDMESQAWFGRNAQFYNLK